MINNGNGERLFCPDCIYLVVVDAGQKTQRFECRRYPPQVMRGGGGESVIFARIDNPVAAWCGELEAEGEEQ